MTKLKMVRLYNAADVPDHLFQEVCNLVDKIGNAMVEPCTGHDLNIILSAFNRFHAAMICSLVSESTLKEAAQTEAIGLIKNVQHMSGQKIFETDE